MEEQLEVGKIAILAGFRENVRDISHLLLILRTVIGKSLFAQDHFSEKQALSYPLLVLFSFPRPK